MTIVFNLVLIVIATIMILTIIVQANKSESIRENIEKHIQNDDSGYYWLSTSPNCIYSCDFCRLKRLSCLIAVIKKVDIPIEYQDKADFGKDCENGGYKVLCGPKVDDSIYYWSGLDKKCDGKCNDCAENGSACLTEASSQSNVDIKFIMYAYKFGNSCSTGSKVLCKVD